MSFWATATPVTSFAVTPARRRASVMERRGNPRAILMRTIRSSLMAETSRPPATTAAPLVCPSVIPRIGMLPPAPPRPESRNIRGRGCPRTLHYAVHGHPRPGRARVHPGRGEDLHRQPGPRAGAADRPPHRPRASRGGRPRPSPGGHDRRSPPRAWPRHFGPRPPWPVCSAARRWISITASSTRAGPLRRPHRLYLERRRPLRRPLPLSPPRPRPPLLERAGPDLPAARRPCDRRLGLRRPQPAPRSRPTPDRSTSSPTGSPRSSSPSRR
jgi:hypothetical protein